MSDALLPDAPCLLDLVDAHLALHAPAPATACASASTRSGGLAALDLDDARRHAAAGDHRRAADALAAAAEMHRETGALAAAVDALDLAAIAAAPDADAQLDLRHRAALLLANLDPAGARDRQAQLAREHEAAGDAVAAARARYCHAWELTGDALVAELERAAATAPGSGWSLRAGARLHLMRGEMHAALAADERALAAARAAGDQHLEALVLGGLGVACSNVGRAGDGVVYLRRAIRLAGHVLDDRWLVLGWLNLTEVLAETLDLTAAIAECRALAAHVERHGIDAWRATVAMHGALLEFRGGRVADAAERSRAVLAELPALGSDPDSIVLALLHGRILVELGALEGIDELLAMIDERVAAYGFESFVFEARALQVRLALVRRDTPAAVAALDAGLAGAGADEPVPVAQLAVTLARAGVLLRDERLARAARTCAERLVAGADPAVDLVLRELDAIDVAATPGVDRAAVAAAAQVARHCARRWSDAGFELESLRARACAALLGSAEQLADEQVAALAAVEAQLRELGAAADCTLVREAAARAETPAAGGSAPSPPTLAQVLGLPAHTDAPGGAHAPLRTRAVAAGDRLHPEPGHVHALVQGRVQLVREAAGGTTVTVAVLGPGELVGAEALIGAAHAAPEAVAAAVDADSAAAAAVDAVAETDAVVALVPVRDLRAVLAASPEAALGVLSLAVRRARQAEALAERLAAWTLQRRLAAVLVELAEHYGHPTLTGGVVLRRAFSQQYLGSRVGVTREAAARAIGAWRESGLLQMRGRRLEFLDLAAIERVAAGGTPAEV